MMLVPVGKVDDKTIPNDKKWLSKQSYESFFAKTEEVENNLQNLQFIF